MEKRTVGFLVTFEDGQHPVIVARAMVRLDQSASPINPSCIGGESAAWGAPKAADGLDLQNLQIRIYRSGSLGSLNEWLDVNVQYDDKRFIGEREAARMARTLAKITKAIRKANAHEAGDVLTAMAGAIGATFHVETRDPRAHYSCYADTDWHWSGISSARDKIRRLMKEHAPAPAPIEEPAAPRGWTHAA